MHLTDQELATILAALRNWQISLDGGVLQYSDRFSEHFADYEPLDSIGIDSLCDRLNTTDPAILGGLSIGHPFTPGEWSVDRDCNGELAIWDEFGNHLLHSESSLPCEEREANAALMARSPVMHHALRMIAAIADMQVLNGNSEPDDMAANLSEISDNLGEIQGIVRKALIQGITPA